MHNHLRLSASAFGVSINRGFPHSVGTNNLFLGVFTKDIGPSINIPIGKLRIYRYCTLKLGVKQRTVVCLH